MDPSVVEYLSGHEGYSCGYCHSSDTCFSHGMWAHTLSTLDYQNLIDRGWRRSGKYCYKPTMHLTCCPLYTIRCATNQVCLTRSQKKVLKKVHRFLCYGEKAKTSEASSSKDTESDHDMEVSEYPQEVDMQSLKRIKKVNQINPSDISADESAAISTDSQVLQSETSDNPTTHSPVKSSHTSPVKSGPSPPVNSNSINIRPQCRKAKEIRKERKLQKLLQKGISQQEATEALKKTASEPKSLEDFLFQSFPSQPAHKLELRLVPSDLENALFLQTFEESHSVYKKYQMAIHKDPPEKCSAKQFIRFLVNSPFQTRNSNPALGKISYGSFHQQYWLDNKLIAVGVMDILPYCVSSVYFFYDPDYSFLSLGTYAALREIAFARELNKKLPDLQYYYMGFYIHSCVKMRYKGQFIPSFLLCPETNIFQPIEKCKPKLDNAKYSRLEEDLTKEDTDGVVNLREVLILFERTKMSYPVYNSRNRGANDEAEVREYASFVGRKCYRRMLLFRES